MAASQAFDADPMRDKKPSQSIRTWDREYLLHEELSGFEEFSDVIVEIPYITDLDTCIKGYLYCLKVLTHELNHGAVTHNMDRLKALSHELQIVINEIKELAHNNVENIEYFKMSKEILHKLTLLSAWDSMIVSLVSQFFSHTEKFVKKHEQVHHLPFLAKLHDQFLRIKDQKTSVGSCSSVTDPDLSTTTTTPCTNDTSDNESSIFSSVDLSLPSSVSQPTMSYEKELSVHGAPQLEELTEHVTKVSNSDVPDSSSEIESFPPTPKKVHSEEQPSASTGIPVVLHKNKKRPFTLVSDVKLIHGVEVHGVGNWTTILKNLDFPKFRTAGHLKDRWRTLCKLGIVSETDENGFILMEPHKTEVDKYKETEKIKREKNIPTILLTRSQQNRRKPVTRSTTSSCSSDQVAGADEEEDPEKNAAVNNRPTEESSSSPNMSENLPETRAGATDACSSTQTEPNQDTSPSTENNTAEEVDSQTDSQPGVDEAAPDHARASAVEHILEPNIAISHVVSLAGSSNESLASEPEQNEPTRRVSPREKKEPAPKATQKATKTKRRRLWDIEGEVMTWDEPDIQPTFISRKEAVKVFDTIEEIPKGTHKKVVWAEWEVENLMKGIERYGQGQWAMILDEFKFKNRTACMLKDKYRNILKSKKV